MNHHGTHTHRLHEDHVDQQVAYRLRVLHHRSAKLDHHELAAKFADITQGLNQYFGLADLFFVLHQHHPLQYAQGGRAEPPNQIGHTHTSELNRLTS